MRLIAQAQNENALVEELAKELRENRGIYADVTNYEDGFGFTVFSIDDLASYDVTRGWSREEKIDFMEYAGHKIGGANEDHWEIIEAQLTNYIDNRKKKNDAYLSANYPENAKTKFYLDVCGGGWVRRVYYNPDSSAGGQLVNDLLSNQVISAAGRTCATDEEFWNYTYEHARQTLVDIDTIYFEPAAKSFVEDPCDLVEQTAETMESLKKWAEASLFKCGGANDD